MAWKEDDLKVVDLYLKEQINDTFQKLIDIGLKEDTDIGWYVDVMRMLCSINVEKFKEFVKQTDKNKLAQLFTKAIKNTPQEHVRFWQQ